MSAKWKDLTKKELKHVRAMGIATLREFKNNASFQAKQRKQFPDASEPCWDCRAIAKKLGLEV